LAHSLTGEQADLDLRLVQPTAVFRGVVHGETLPQQAADLLAEPVHQRPAIMRTQIVHHQMDGVCLRIVANLLTGRIPPVLVFN
jgi:hypothetical protein